MLSKFALVHARSPCVLGAGALPLWPRSGAGAAARGPMRIQVRRSTGDIFPPTQYDTPWPDKMKFGNVVSNNWEIIPLFAITAFAMSILIFHIIWASKNKVDVVFQTHSRENISRTMDLNYPKVHKLVTINQIYEPWPEMSKVFKKMHDAEHRELARQDACKYH